MRSLCGNFEEVQQQLSFNKAVVWYATVLVHATAAICHLLDVVGPARVMTRSGSRLRLPILGRPIHFGARSLCRPLVERI
jgi:hypothetical protein